MKSIKHTFFLSFTIIAGNTYSMDAIKPPTRRMTIFEYFNQEVTNHASKITDQNQRLAFITNAYSNENFQQLKAEDKLHRQAHFVASHLLSIHLSPSEFEKASEISLYTSKPCPTPQQLFPKKTQLKPSSSSMYGNFDIPPYVEKSIDWKSLTY